MTDEISNETVASVRLLSLMLCTCINNNEGYLEGFFLCSFQASFNFRTKSEI